MKALIAYWRAKLAHNRWLMGEENRVMIEQTIRALTELEKLRAITRVEREAEIVRTVKQLGMTQPVADEVKKTFCERTPH